MGNKVITGVCTRDDSLDVEDFSRADFDFISVAVRSGSACATPSSRAFVSASKLMVAIVPVDLSLNLSHNQSPSPFGKVSMKPTTTPQTSTTTTAANSPPTPVTDDEPELSFNDRLNMLKWDPEDFALPSKGTKRHDVLRTPEASIFKPILSTSRRPEMTSPEPMQLKHKTSFGWLSRAISSYKSSFAAAKKKQAKDLQKKTEKTEQQQQQDDQDKQQQQQQKKTMFKTQASSIKTQATPKTNINHDQDQGQAAVQTTEQLKHNDNDDNVDYEDPISDTESESSAAELSFCSDSIPSTSTSMFATAHSFLCKEPSSDSIGSCETFEVDDSDADQASLAYFSSANAFSSKMRDFLCSCGSCPLYHKIEREVTTSICWMNERERQSICRILQAYSTYNEAVGFSKAMIACAEECLLVFHGDESAAFSAFVLLGQEKWEK